jgi:hypothetical protein
MINKHMKIQRIGPLPIKIMQMREILHMRFILFLKVVEFYSYDF